MGSITCSKVLALLLVAQLAGVAWTQTVSNTASSPKAITSPKGSPKKSPPKHRTSPKRSPLKRSPPKRSPPKHKPAPKRSPPKHKSPPKRSPRPAPGKLHPLVFPRQRAPLCYKTFSKGQQCGGNGGSCASWPRHVKKCPDAYWNQACCQAGTSCQRVTAARWECRPVKIETLRSLPKPSELPPNSTLVARILDSKQLGPNGKPKHRYILIKTAVNWYTAEAICQYYYGLHLASIHDVAEMWRVNNQCYAHMQSMCWIGANDLRQRGVFRWTDGSSWDWAWWQQNEGPSWYPTQRCVALQDGFQSHPCDNPIYYLAVACQVY